MSNHNTIGHLRRHTYRIPRTLSYRPNDMWEALFSNGDELRPPRSKTLIYGYDPEFQKIGQEFVEYFIDLAGLQADDDVLDIGSGIGRIAIPLAAWLSPQGSYHGFELVAEGVRWCRQHITAKYPNFHFERADIYNATYNPGGRFTAREYRFPYPDASFDFVWTKSVFTHMFAEDVEHYLQETARVLRSGGRALHTFFILNEESQRLIGAGKSMFDFRFHLGESVTVSEAEPEKAIAFDERLVRAMYEGAGLQILEPIHWGAWSGRREFLSGQEIVVAIKP